MPAAKTSSPPGTVSKAAIRAALEKPNATKPNLLTELLTFNGASDYVPREEMHPNHIDALASNGIAV